jgi:hypothetical protein
MSRQHTLYVAVEDGMALFEGEREYGARRGSADAGQVRDRFYVRGKPPLVLVANDLCRMVQVARAGVVTETRPMLQHLVQCRIGEGYHIREAVHESYVIRDDRLHLRLLQHDLGDPDAVSVAGVLPRQVLAAIVVVPAQHARREIIRHQEGSPWPELRYDRSR